MKVAIVLIVGVIAAFVIPFMLGAFAGLFVKGAAWGWHWIMLLP